MNTWLSLLPPLLTIGIASWSKRIIPALLIGLLAGGYLLHPTLTGGFEGAVDKIVETLTDKGNLQVLLFLYLFSGLIGLVKRSGGIAAFSKKAENHIKSEKGVFLTMWALIPVTFIDCGFRIVGAGSITLPLAEKYKISRERLAFMLNNTASPVVELIPIATTFVGFNVAIVAQGIKAAGLPANTSAYAIWLQAIPLEFFSIVVLLITFSSIFVRFKPSAKTPKHAHVVSGDGAMGMNMEGAKPVIEPRVINLIIPMVSVIVLSVFFFWFFGTANAKSISILAAIADSEPNRAMLVALVITLAITSVCYFFQKYSLQRQTEDVISGGNDIVTTLVILSIAWPLAAVSQDLGLNELIKMQLGNSLPAWSVPLSLFLLSSAVTYFTGSGWGAASLIMPFALPLAASVGSGIPLCVAAVISGGTFGDVTSPVAGMTNMSSNITKADHGKYISYAARYNFGAAAIAAVLFMVAGFLR
ncbi:MAG: Na+/H+ antiporter NhaC family protein [Opitutus sp.]